MISLTYFFHSFINTLFPNYCIACEIVLDKAGVGLCSQCFSKLASILIRKRCNICSSPQINDNEVCDSCLKEQIGYLYYDRNISLYLYRDIIVELIREAKFANRYSIWGLFFTQLSEVVLKEIEMLDKAPLIVPVPISKAAYKKRGFNQSELLAKAIAKNNRLRYSKYILIKNRDNKQQSNLTFQDRVINPKGCYSISNRGLIGDNELVFLIDDVFTTGSTVNECARLLKSAGIKKVISFTVAR